MQTNNQTKPHGHKKGCDEIKGIADTVCNTDLIVKFAYYRQSFLRITLVDGPLNESCAYIVWFRAVLIDGLTS